MAPSDDFAEGHRRCQPGSQRLILSKELLMLQQTLNTMQQPIPIYGLGHAVVSARPHCFNSLPDTARRGKGDDPHIRGALTHYGDKQPLVLCPRVAGNDSRCGRTLSSGQHGLRRGSNGLNAVSGSAKRLGDRLSKAILGLDDQNQD
jgi:hypothetical protein